MKLNHFDESHAHEVARLCTVAYNAIDRMYTVASGQERLEHGHTAQNAILRVREIAERFQGDERKHEEPV